MRTTHQTLEEKRETRRRYYLRNKDKFNMIYTRMTDEQKERYKDKCRENSRIRFANMTDEEREEHRAYCREYYRIRRLQRKDPTFTTRHREYIR